MLLQFDEDFKDAELTTTLDESLHLFAQNGPVPPLARMKSGARDSKNPPVLNTEPLGQLLRALRR